jgi:hypothetical protein
MVRAYRSGLTGSERRQVRWLVLAMVASMAPWIALNVVPIQLGRPPLLSPFVVGLLWCAIPAALAIAILRERLFDIDLIINRSLVYGTLTALLALVYFASVVLLQAALRAFTGEARSQLVTVLSTLGIAALAAPLRVRVQRLIDRRFFRRRYDAARTLAAFANTARDDVDLNELSRRLVAVVDETMQPAHMSLWLRR